MIREQRPIPPPNVPLVEPNGLMSREWYDYFRDLDRVTRELVRSNEDHEIRITTLEP